MSRNLVTVKTKHGHIRVPADQAPKPNAAEARHEALLHEPIAPEPEPDAESDDDLPG